MVCFLCRPVEVLHFNLDGMLVVFSGLDVWLTLVCSGKLSGLRAILPESWMRRLRIFSGLLLLKIEEGLKSDEISADLSLGLPSQS